MAREFDESSVFFANAVENADGRVFGKGETDDLAAGAAEFALEGDDVLGRSVEMALEKFFKDIHSTECDPICRGEMRQLAGFSIADFGGRELRVGGVVCLEGRV